MRKGEIARYEQFLFFPQCFQKACSQGHQKVSLCGNGLNLRETDKPVRHFFLRNTNHMIRNLW